jgi:hypothetical protein
MTDLSQTIHDWIAFNRQLVSVGNQIASYLTDTENRKYPQNLVLAGISRKTANSLNAIHVLVDNSHWEEAQVLARVLFELRATFACFWKMFSDDDVAATQRIFDCMMLDKFKQIRQINRKDFDDAVDRNDWEIKIQEIEERYEPDELKRMKSHGFTGRSVEERCRHANLTHAYEVIYRNFSRNVHSTDFIEQIGDLAFRGDRQHDDYLNSRNATMLYIANYSAGGILINTDIEDRFAQEFSAFKTRHKSLMEHVDVNEGF